jgi:hypothetical protein
LLSRDAINHPDKDWQNFSKLTADSKCDNVFLEHRLAVELQGLGLIEKVFPVFIGDVDAATGQYGNYYGGKCNPSLPSVAVKSVEEKILHHMESQALGTPLEPDRTVLSVVTAITACQGHFIEGAADATFAAAAASIAKMLRAAPAPAPAPAVLAAGHSLRWQPNATPAPAPAPAPATAPTLTPTLPHHQRADSPRSGATAGLVESESQAVGAMRAALAATHEENLHLKGQLHRVLAVVREAGGSIGSGDVGGGPYERSAPEWAAQIEKILI